MLTKAVAVTHHHICIESWRTTTGQRTSACNGIGSSDIYKYNVLIARNHRLAFHIFRRALSASPLR
jgi:hypothetical protein